MSCRHLPSYRSLLVIFAGLMAASPAFAAEPTVAQALALRPIQDDVDYDKPSADEQPQCTVQAEKFDDHTAWAVRNAAGQLLRRFADTNSDNKVDLWCYYRGGIEVYRDVDANFNGKADQYRWLGTAGTRWGVDRDEDGQIDAWKSISPEEVTAEVVAAFRSGKGDRMRRLLLTSEEQAALKLGREKDRQLSEKVQAAKTAFPETAFRAALPRDAKWIHFGGALPGVVPAGTEGSTADLTVYENVVAMIERGDNKHGQVYIGTLVRVGEAWRMIDIPRVLEASESPSTDGFFFASIQQRPDANDTAMGAVDNSARDTLVQLEAIDKDLAAASSPAAQAKLHKKRADLLEGFIDQAIEDEERSIWIRQYGDTVSAATQSGVYPDGAQRLQALLAKLKKNQADRDLEAFVYYRWLEATYSLSLQESDADYEKIQQQWLQNLGDFVKSYPTSPDAAEAMIQLALAAEFAGNDDEAKKWYQRVTGEFADSERAKKAAGSLRRIASVGKSMSLRGTDISGNAFDLAKYRGKVVVVQYWATWCDACTRDMAMLNDLVTKYGQRGFAVVGVNLDADRNKAVQFVQQKRLPWVQLHEAGGLGSRYATEMGVLSLPVTLLIDSQGKVVNRGLQVSQAEEELKKVLR